MEKKRFYRLRRFTAVFTALAMIFTFMPVTPVEANTVLRMSGNTTRHAPTINGWDIEAWTDTRLPGSSTMTVNDNGGAFTCEWNGTYNTLFRTGKKFSPMPAASTFTSSSGNASIRYDVRNFSSANGATYLCIYGWTNGSTGNNTTGGAIIEWYIVDNWMHWNPERAGTSGTYQRHGTTTINGNVYDVISAWRINQPWVGPGSNGTFLQLFNVRRNSQITGSHPVTNTLTGTIDVAAHFQSWIDLGIINNPSGSERSRFTGSSQLYEISFTLEGYGGTGGSSGRGDVRNLCLAYSGSTRRLCTWNGCVNCNGSTTTPTTGITIDRSGTWTFTERDAGYTTAPTARSVTVTNSGTGATGAMTVELSGTGASAFTLSATTLSSIQSAGSTREFTVQPRTGLAAGTYTATVTVSGTGLTSRSFNVSFTVNPAAVTPTFGISLSQTSTLTFPSAAVGYGEREWVPITVTNTGNQPTGALTVTLPTGFSIQGTTGMTGGIAVGATRTFDIRPSRNLEPGTYTGAVTVTGGNGISRSFNVSFTVTGGTAATTVAVTTPVPATTTPVPVTTMPTPATTTPTPATTTPTPATTTTAAATTPVTSTTTVNSPSTTVVTTSATTVTSPTTTASATTETTPPTTTAAATVTSPPATTAATTETTPPATTAATTETSPPTTTAVATTETSPPTTTAATTSPTPGTTPTLPTSATTTTSTPGTTPTLPTSATPGTTPTLPTSATTVATTPPTTTTPVTTTMSTTSATSVDITTPITTPTEPKQRLSGDVDLNERITINDALEILKYLAKLDSVLNNDPVAMRNALILNPEASSPSIGDALEILKHLAKLESLAGVWIDD